MFHSLAIFTINNIGSFQYIVFYEYDVLFKKRMMIVLQIRNSYRFIIYSDIWMRDLHSYTWQSGKHLPKPYILWHVTRKHLHPVSLCVSVFFFILFFLQWHSWSIRNIFDRFNTIPLYQSVTFSFRLPILNLNFRVTFLCHCFSHPLSLSIFDNGVCLVVRSLAWSFAWFSLSHALIPDLPLYSPFLGCVFIYIQSITPYSLDTHSK